MATPLPTIFLNGEYLPLSKANISPLDRGFLFGDAVYEVVPVYDGRPFLLDAHLDRLERSLAEIRIDNPLTRAEWTDMFTELVGCNGGGNLALYFQITRGADVGRDHPFPIGTRPTVFAMVQPLSPICEKVLDSGIEAITVEDLRWARCDIKSTSLLPNVVLRQAANDQNAAEAILVRDGLAMEGTSSSLFAVVGGGLVTPPKSHHRLPGTTRDLILKLAEREKIDSREREIPVAELETAEEIWICSAAREVLPVTRLDGKPVGNGRPGPVWRRVYDRFQIFKAGRDADAA